MKSINIFLFCTAALVSNNAFANAPEPTNVGVIGTWIEFLFGTPAAPGTTDGNGREIMIEDPSS